MHLHRHIPLLCELFQHGLAKHRRAVPHIHFGDGNVSEECGEFDFGDAFHDAVDDVGAYGQRAVWVVEGNGRIIETPETTEEDRLVRELVVGRDEVHGNMASSRECAVD